MSDVNFILAVKPCGCIRAVDCDPVRYGADFSARYHKLGCSIRYATNIPDFGVRCTHGSLEQQLASIVPADLSMDWQEELTAEQKRSIP